VEGHTKSLRLSTDVQVSCLGRKLFSAAEGYIEVGDVTLEPDDLVCVLFGGFTSFCDILMESTDWLVTFICMAWCLEEHWGRNGRKHSGLL
jgi:hypothetical protein